MSSKSNELKGGGLGRTVITFLGIVIALVGGGAVFASLGRDNLSTEGGLATLGAGMILAIFGTFMVTSSLTEN